MAGVPDIYDVTTAPVTAPRAFGGLSVFDFEDAGEHAGLGMTWDTTACFQTGVTYNACVDPSVVALTASGCNTQGYAEPFAVYSYDTDSIGSGSRTIAQHEANATARLLAAEQWGFEQYLVAYLIANKADVAMAGLAPAADGNTSAERALIALATAEEATAQITNNERILFMNTWLGSILISQNALKPFGGVMKTQLGTKVAITAPNQLGGTSPATIYGTGPWKAHRAAVETLNGTTAPGTAVNDVSIIAQRTYALGTACGVVAVDSGILKTP
jgi:hypothetical protein